MATLETIFADYANRERVWHDSHFTRTTRNQFKDRALSAFDDALAKVLGHPIPKFKPSMTPTQRAIAAAATRDEATKAYDAAIAKEAAKRGGTSGGKFKKYAAKIKGYYDKRVSQIDKAYADSSKGPGNGVTGSPPDDKTGGTKPPGGKTNLSSGNPTAPEEGPNLFLWAGIGALIWYFWRK